MQITAQGKKKRSLLGAVLVAESQSKQKTGHTFVWILQLIETEWL